ncbi:ketoacyl-ACP synthase III family protein [Kitasatospora kifunensis]|uniref:3-oxoacyl-[acyl-carrier-protein] synthase-3 n=1 Tax=Kitasatospora kifunensis TaxID=58351 RepID=A0A7W7VZ43_KITKI|nr:ketoacyl-ACP synthase III family protein [Kitasatospora kifunensis]MBB4927673.1 3-oxoacyl-[acyl-carrier-protein] synthase-3 [Kitasatospora kifunensis]
MRWRDLYVSGVGVALPGSVSARQAIAEGLYTREQWEAGGMLSAAVAAEGDTAVDLAVTAAREALDQGRCRAGDLGLILHASLLAGGPDIWNPASYIQRELVATHAFVAGVRDASNGGMASFELAAAYLSARPVGFALLTAADLWPACYLNRWHYASCVFGDGAGALLLSRTGGFARVLATATASDPELEALSRGAVPVGTYPPRPGETIDLNQRAARYLETHGREETCVRVSRGFGTVVHDLLAQLGMEPRDIDRIVTAHVARDRIRDQLAAICPDCGLERTTWEFARTVGHLGAADQFAGLHHLQRSQSLTPGDHVLLLGVGVGFTWSAAMLEVT